MADRINAEVVTRAERRILELQAEVASLRLAANLRPGSVVRRIEDVERGGEIRAVMPFDGTCIIAAMPTRQETA